MSDRKQCKSIRRTPAHIRQLEAHLGVTFCDIETTRGGHLKLHLPGIDHFFIVARTPSDKRWLYNATSNIRRHLRSLIQENTCGN